MADCLAVRAVCAPKCLEKDAHADFLCLHCYPNAVGDNTWAYLFFYSFIYLFIISIDYMYNEYESRNSLQRRDCYAIGLGPDRHLSAQGLYWEGCRRHRGFGHGTGSLPTVSIQKRLFSLVHC